MCLCSVSQALPQHCHEDCEARPAQDHARHLGSAALPAGMWLAHPGHVLQLVCGSCDWDVMVRVSGVPTAHAHHGHDTGDKCLPGQEVTWLHRA